MLQTAALTDEIRRITINGRDFDLDVSANRLRPVICGGSDIPPAPPTPPAPPAPGPTPPAPPAPDLPALQSALDAAQAQGNTVGTTALLKALGFEKIEDAQSWVTAKRDEEAAALTEVEKREKAAADREAAAEKKDAAAGELINRGVIREALRDAGCPAVNLDDAFKLVDITGDVTAETAKTAAEALKAKPAFASLFSAPGTITAPSGVTPPGGPTHPNPAGKGIEAGRELAKKQREAEQARNPLNTLHVVGAQRTA